MLNPGVIINQRYQLRSKLGKNAGRQTWLAKDLQAENSENTDNLVVVKLLAFGGDVQWEDLKLFEREAQTLQQLEHSRIPQYQDYFSIEDRNLWFGLVQQYIPGSSLRELLDKGRRFSEAEVKKVATEILNILLYLHGFNPPLLHRDIKPSNLILGTDNNIYLVDFGAVQDKAATEGATFTVVGTYGYAPMEQFGGKAVPASDLYALGATLIHLLTRTSPGDLPTKDLRIQFRDRIVIENNFSSWLEKMIHPAVERRFSTAKQALRDLTSEKKTDLRNKKNLPLSLLASKRVKIINETNYLEITIRKRGLKFNNYDLGNLLTAIIFFTVSILLALALPNLMGLAILCICCVTFYPYLDYLFADTKVMITSEKVLISKTLFLKTRIFHQKTKSIQDISINYQAIKRPRILDPKSTIDRGAIMITVKETPLHKGYQQYSFGKGLSEAEAIWIAKEIRTWLKESE